MPSKGKVLVMGAPVWADKEMHEMLGHLADVVYMESQSREELFKDFAEGGRYADTTAIFHSAFSAKLVGQPDKELIDALPASCKWLAHKGAGYDSVDVHAAKARGLNVSNTPGAVDEATATTGVYLLIGAMRNFSQGEKHLRNGGFAPMPEVEARSSDLSGKTIGILGMGSIGVTFARMIQPFGMRILYHNRRESPSAPDFVTYVKDLDEMLEQVDVLSVNMPLSAATEGFVDERKIRKLRKGSIIINTARGKIIDEEALIKALEDGHLAAAGLDVFATEPKVDPRLIAMPNTTLLPHIGTENKDSRKKMEIVALTNIRDFLAGGVGPNLVPECQ